jgi:SAM-dependent methyltransferase
MGFYDAVVVPHLIDLACGVKDLVPERRKAMEGLAGTVLEIGFGSGLNAPHYPPSVTRVLAVDPSERGRHIGRKRIAAAPCPIETVGLDAEVIDVGDATADAALSTFTLCSIPAAERALREVHRILKPGAKLYFLEHGRAPDAGVARWQDRLNGLERALCGGCNLNRDIPGLVTGAGFRLERSEAAYFPRMPRTHGFLYRGVAVRE